MREIWIRSPWALAAIFAGVFGIVFLVAWREIRDALVDVRNLLLNLFGD